MKTKTKKQTKTETDWFKNLESSAAKIGARLHLIPKLMVDYTKPHNEAAIAGGPQTGKDYNVLKVGDQYQPSENKATEETVILLNWPKGGGSYQKAVEWGLANGLRKTTPHVPFAVGENFPKLNYGLGPNPMYVVETTGCSFKGNARACCVWWDDAERKSLLAWQSSFGNGLDWFAFRKSELGTDDTSPSLEPLDLGLKKISTTYKLTDNIQLIQNEEDADYVCLTENGEACSGIMKHWNTKEKLAEELREILHKVEIL